MVEPAAVTSGRHVGHGVALHTRDASTPDGPDLVARGT
jgi:hypothetical protein